jgi:Flp pilus assembly protein TadG
MASRTIRSTRRGRAAQAGAASIEMALAAVPFFLVLFFLAEYCRGLYVYIALQEVTRAAARGASVTRFADAAAMDAVRRKAMLGGASGVLPMSGGIDHSYLRIAYLSLSAANVMTPVDTLTLTPEANLAACAASPNAPTCIRFVKVQVCSPASAPGGCEPAPYVPMMPLPLVRPLFASFTLPLSTTLTPAESLGARTPCGPC